MTTCFHCHEEIEKSKDAACGWRHVESRRVICRPTDATPMDKVQQMAWNCQQEQSALFRAFDKKPR
jgi:uncharacterized CHY-type Zn-finger protein